MSTPLRILTSSLIILLRCSIGGAQFGDVQTSGARLGESSTAKWRVGVVVRAAAGPCSGLFATVPVPMDWPEQHVRIVNEEISPSVKRVQYREVGNGVKQMTIQIPRLQAGETAKALVTFEVDRRVLLEPEKPDSFQLPEDLPRELRAYLLPSPYIEVRHPKIVSLAKELRDDTLSAWRQVEVIYDYVRDHVEYKDGKLKGAVAALRDGTGDCEELTSLFIALCRANKIPARTVWVPNHCYAEFYLAAPDGEGHWFPCQLAGSRDFGRMPDLRPVLQKGDNFKVPERRERQRYVSEFLTGKSIRGAPPHRQFVRELMAKD